MEDLLSRLITTDNGLLIAIVAFAWRYLAGEHRASIERRVREACRAGWYGALAITGLKGTKLYDEAWRRTVSLLAKLGIKKTSDVGRLIEHELQMLAIEQQIAEMPQLSPDPERLFEEAEARGRANPLIKPEHLDNGGA